MKAKLIKVNDYYYLRESYKTGIGGAVCERTLGTTNSQGELGKLSKKNCDEIFRITDVEKLACEYCNNIPLTLYEQDIYSAGFNKAMELNKDKQFTEEDVRKAYIYGVSNCHSFGHSAIDYTDKCIQSLQQPAEIEVEIEMEGFVDEEGIYCGERPKLDPSGCVILKKK
jgi:cation transport regulator ChaB